MDSLHHLHLAHPWPIVVCGVFLWILGAAWYSPALFSKPWMAALNITPNTGDMKKGLIFGMVCSLIGDLILAFFLWHIIAWSEATGWWAGAFIGGIVWAGFFAAPNFPQGIYERRPFKLFAINNLYWFIGLQVCGGILATWR